MSTRVKMVKQNNISIGVDETHDLSQLRTKFRYEGPSLKEWVDKLQTTIKDDKIVPTVISYFKEPNPEKPSEKPVPPELLPFINFMLEEKRIPQSEVRGYTFHVIKPALKIEPPTSDYENIIEQCKVYVSDRFIFTDGSRELINYRIIDIRKMTAMAGIGAHQQMIENIEEQVKDKDVICMDLQAAISMRLHINNRSSYDRPNRKGFRKGVKIPKNPMSRYIVVMDVIATADKVQNVLRNKTEMIQEIIHNKPESEKAKIIRSFNNNAPSVVSHKEEEIKEDESNVPDLVDLALKDTAEASNPDVFNEDIDDDVLNKL